MPDPSSSIHSLQSALHNAHKTEALLFSPTSVGTGATGSTEEPGSATRSLACSVAARSSAREYTSARSNYSTDHEDRLRTPEGSRHRIRPDSDKDIPFKFLPSPSVASDASWSQVSSPLATRTRKASSGKGEIVIKREEGELESDDENDLTQYYLPVTKSQEEDGLGRSVTRSQSDFSRWLEDTMANARGDGTSTVCPRSLALIEDRWLLNLRSFSVRWIATGLCHPSRLQPVRLEWDSVRKSGVRIRASSSAPSRHRRGAFMDRNFCASWTHCWMRSLSGPPRKSQSRWRMRRKRKSSSMPSTSLSSRVCDLLLIPVVFGAQP
jgi:hypothetical protein